MAQHGARNAIVDFGEVRECVQGAGDIIRTAIQAAGGTTEEVRPGRLIIDLPGETRRVEVSITEDDYLPRVLECFQREGRTIPPTLRQVFIERGLLDPEEAP
ncbi:MAG: hypothetical protein ABIG71_02780 [Candidatus Uhrbacteria bacterium]